MTRRLAKPRPVQGEAGSDDAARRGTGYTARAVAQAPAKRDGHPRQNPAYRPATEKALATGLFLFNVKGCITRVHRAGAYGLGLRVESAGFVGVNRIVEPKAAAPASTKESVRLCFGAPGRWTSAAKSSCVIPSTFRSHRFGGGSPGPCPRKGGGNDAEALL